MKPFSSLRSVLVVSAIVSVSLLAGGAGALLGVCGPFTDVSDATFCPFVLEIFYLGITTGTTPTTYSPTDTVTRLQMAAFLSRTVDRTLQRGSPRAALDQFWTTQNATVLGLTTVGAVPFLAKSDGTDVWVANNSGNSVSRVRVGDGKLLETWTGASTASGVLVAMGRVFATNYTFPGRLYQIDPTQPAGVVTTVATNLANFPAGITFDGARIWAVGVGVSIVTPGATIPWTVTTVTAGFGGEIGAVYDGANVWATNASTGTIQKLDSAAAVLQTVTVGGFPYLPAFDGSNIWVPNQGSTSVSVVRASTGAVLATLTGNGLSSPRQAAFDGERVLVTNSLGNSVSLWKAADLTAIGTFSTGASTGPFGACSDGKNFWITLQSTSQLARF